jgi:hypothetical protein
MDLREIGWWNVDLIQLAQYRDKWRALVNTVMNLRVSYCVKLCRLMTRLVSAQISHLRVPICNVNGCVTVHVTLNLQRDVLCSLYIKCHFRIHSVGFPDFPTRTVSYSI